MGRRAGGGAQTAVLRILIGFLARVLEAVRVRENPTFCFPDRRVFVLAQVLEVVRL